MATTSEPELTLPKLPDSVLEAMTPLEREFLDKTDGELLKLHKRFAEPKAQFDRLMGLRSRITGQNGVSAAGAGSGRSPSRSATGRGSRSGVNRRKEFLDLVESNPGITAKQAAEAMNIEPNYVYRVRGNLEKEGVIRTEDGHHYLTEQAVPA